MLSRREAAEKAQAAEREANDQGLIRTVHLLTFKEHFDRLVRITNQKYHTEFGNFKTHCISVPNAEAILRDEDVNNSYCRSAPFMPVWVLQLILIEREWRKNPFKRAEDHDDIVAAFHQGLQGNLDAVESFFGIYDLNRQSDKELNRSPVQADNSGWMTINETRAANGIQPL